MAVCVCVWRKKEENNVESLGAKVVLNLLGQIQLIQDKANFKSCLSNLSVHKQIAN